MAVVLARLKLRLLVNRLRGNTASRIGLALSVLAGTGMALVTVVGLAALRNRPDLAPDVAVVGASVLVAGWTVLPLFVFGVDESLDPARLALLPLTQRQLISGLLLAGLVGVPAVATLVALCGGFVAFARGPGSAVLVAAAVVALLLLCVTASRAVAGALAGLLRSRRGRDLSVVVGALVGISFYLLQLAVSALGSSLDRDLLARVAAVLRWLPGGLAAQAAADAGRGAVGPALLRLAGVAVAIGLLLLWWRRSLSRSLTTADASGAVRSGRPSALFSGLSGRLLPRSRLGAVAARDLRYAWRDPRRRVGWASSLVIGALVPLGPFVTSGSSPGPRAVLAAASICVFAGLQVLNPFGADGTAIWSQVAVGTGSRADLLGKNLAVALIALPAAVVAAILLAALTGGWRLLPVGVSAAVAVLAITSGLGNLASVRAPFAVPENPTNAFAGGGTGAGCSNAAVQLVFFGAIFLAALPLVVTVVLGLTLVPVLLPVAAVAGPVYGVTLWWFVTGAAASRLDSHGPEVLAAVAPRRA